MPGMTVFLCRSCRTRLTPEVALVDLPESRGHDGEPTMLAGTYAVDADPFGPPYVDAPPGHPALRIHARVRVPDGPRGTVVLHPDDFLPERRWSADRITGCCGPAGTEGPNLRCACGSEIATEKNDCCTPHEIRLDPAHVTECELP